MKLFLSACQLSAVSYQQLPVCLPGPCDPSTWWCWTPPLPQQALGCLPCPLPPDCTSHQIQSLLPSGGKEGGSIGLKVVFDVDNCRLYMFQISIIMLNLCINCCRRDRSSDGRADSCPDIGGWLLVEIWSSTSVHVIRKECMSIKHLANEPGLRFSDGKC